ncbi:hypothetical protein FORC22_4808 (plasmid) [Vibrio parahaemolyticus]|nr:hypothetical protein FORC22_4808 [Vibrio parahaemolyticus]
MAITVLSLLFLDSHRAISAFAVIKSLFDLCIKLLASGLALDGFVAMLNPIIKPTSRNSEHLNHTGNAEVQ